MSMCKLLLAGSLALGAFGAASANAQDESYYYSRTGEGMNTWTAPGVTAGTPKDQELLQFFELNYSNIGGVERLAANIDFTPEMVAGRSNSGFWLVLSDGPSPKAKVEYAILYADLNRNIITAYEYNGTNDLYSASITSPGNVLDTFADAMTIVDNGSAQDGDVSFNIDVTKINAAALGTDWDGIQFGEEIGIWFHFSDFLIARATNGVTTRFEMKEQGWIDFSNRSATNCANQPANFAGCGLTQVSEPASAALLGLGLVGLAAYRRREAGL